jgi:serine/threonine protein kinase
MIRGSIGKYRILGQLGRGGMGIVYKAVDETLDREVAIKVLNPDLADERPIKRFRAEATILARLNHPDIATIYDLVDAAGDLLIVMEFVHGETLEAISARSGALPPTSAAALIDRVLSALAHAHRAGIVHCDVKPANIMVTAHGGVKIMDFGTARVRGAERGTLDGCMTGTPAYMAPEQVLGDEVDARADVYGTGVVLYRLLTGHLPFVADNTIAIVQKQVADAPTPLHVHRDGLPDWCETIVQRALAKSPDERFQTADEFRHALQSATGSISGSTNPLGALVHVAATTTPSSLAAQAAPVAKTVVTARPSTASGRRRNTTTSRRRGAKSSSGGTPRRKRRRPWLARPALAVVGVATGMLLVFAVWGPGLTRLQSIYSGVPRMADSAEPSTGTASYHARLLIGSGERQREVKCRMVLDADTVRVEDDRHSAFHEVPYEHVRSISYSHGPDPLWTGPSGPARIVRVSGGTLSVLGVFVMREWISLRTTNPDAEFVVLRFDDEAQARRAVRDLENRTRLKADEVGSDPRD